MSKALMAGGLFFLLSGPISAASYYSKLYPAIQSFSYAALAILILILSLCVLFDETVGNAIAVKALEVRFAASLSFICLISSITLYAFALNRIIALYWLCGIAIAAVLIGILAIYLMGKGDAEYQ
jgi:hypothetical protein